MDMRTNMDDIRAEIMRLEDAKVFDQRAWAIVLMQLAGHPTRRADAARRMGTAKANQLSQEPAVVLEVNIRQPLMLSAGVAVETALEIDRLIMCADACFSHGALAAADDYGAMVRQVASVNGVPASYLEDSNDVSTD